MKKVIILILLFSQFFSISCKKDNSQNNTPPTPFQNYIKFKLDNVQTECTSLIKATYFQSLPDTSIKISGAWNAGSFALDLSGNGQTLKPGIYTFNSTKWHSGTIWTTSPAIRYVAGMDLYLNIFEGSGNVTISEISNEYIKGTFEFITGIDIPTSTFKTVASGVFHIKRG